MTGIACTTDAKIDTGAVVSFFPMSVVTDMGLEIIGERDLITANGDIMHAYICLCVVTLSKDDSFEMPIYVCKTKSDVSLIGMDILQQCDFSFIHEKLGVERYINFTLSISE